MGQKGVRPRRPPGEKGHEKRRRSPPARRAAEGRKAQTPARREGQQKGLRRAPAVGQKTGGELKVQGKGGMEACGGGGALEGFISPLSPYPLRTAILWGKRLNPSDFRS